MKPTSERGPFKLVKVGVQLANGAIVWADVRDVSFMVRGAVVATAALSCLIDNSNIFNREENVGVKDHALRTDSKTGA